MEYVDLHMHSKHSNEKCSVLELLKMAEEEKLKYISITDHDTISAYDELRNINVKEYYSGKIITGVELKVVFEGHSIEVLGYNYNVNEIDTSRWTTKEMKRKMQEDQFEFLKKKYLKMGAKITKGLKLLDGKYANNTLYFDMLQYPENEEILSRFPIHNLKEMYRKYISNPGSELFFDETPYHLELEEAVKTIHKAGGIAILAHPLGTYRFKDVKEHIDSIVNKGLVDGLECMHQTMNSEQSKYLKDICKKKDLLMTGGSDFHRKDRTRFGYVNFGEEKVPIKLVDKFLKKVEEKYYEI